MSSQALGLPFLCEVVGWIPASDIEPFEAFLAFKRPQRPDMSSDWKSMAQTTYVILPEILLSYPIRQKNVWHPWWERNPRPQFSFRATPVSINILPHELFPIPQIRIYPMTEHL